MDRLARQIAACGARQRPRLQFRLQPAGLVRVALSF
jgi:hypothetical protein